MTQATLTEKQRKYEVKRLYFTERYSPVKGFADDRPVLPDDLCKRLVQSLIDDDVPKASRIAVVDCTPALMLHLHEAGFTNLTMLNNKQVKALRKKDNEWLSLIQRLYTNFSVDTIDLMSEAKRFDIIIGNPPYGHAASLAVKFLNHAFDICHDVRLVLPRSITGKTTVLNRVRLDIVCRKDEPLPSETFPSNIQANYQQWAPGKRTKKKRVFDHEDWTWLNAGSDQKPDLVIRAHGTRSGCMYFPDHEKFDRYCNTGYYIGVKAEPAVVERFRAIEDDLIKAADSCNGRPHAGKAFIVDFYKQRYS